MSTPTPPKPKQIARFAVNMARSNQITVAQLADPEWREAHAAKMGTAAADLVKLPEPWDTLEGMIHVNGWRAGLKRAARDFEHADAMATELQRQLDAGMWKKMPKRRMRKFRRLGDLRGMARDWAEATA